MPGQRPTGSRTKGSWLPRLAGLVLIVLVAAGGITAYLVVVPQGRAARPLPSKVVSNQSVGLVAEAAATTGSQLIQLLGLQGSPSFTPFAAAEQAQGTPEWYADLMAGNTYIFIFLPSDKCLAATGKAKLVLQHCDLSARQRWRRLHTAVVRDGHDFYQYANLADGRCLSQLGVAPGELSGAGLARCDPVQPASQLIAFWWQSV